MKRTQSILNRLTATLRTRTVRIATTAALVMACLAMTAGTASAAHTSSSRTVTVVMDGYKTGGQAWDMLGGAPDPYIIVDSRSYRPVRCQDAFHCTFEVFERGLLHVAVYDADVAVDDYAGAAYCSSGNVCNTRDARIHVSY